MIDFLKEGKRLDGIEMGTSIDYLIKVKGEPDDIVGDETGGYLYYKQYRYGYDISKSIVEMSIEFSNLEDKFKFKKIENFFYGEKLYRSFKIGSKTKINEFIIFLNFLQIGWEANNTTDNDYLTIKIINGPFVLFDLSNGNPFRISIIDGYQ